MATKDLARAICQGGHDVDYNTRVRVSHRRRRQATKRYVATMVVDGFSDALIEVEHVNWGYADKDSTGNGSALRRWLAAQVGKSWEEVWHRLCLTGRDSIAKRRLLDEARNAIAFADEDDWRYHDYVVDRDGILCRATEFENTPRFSPRWAKYDGYDKPWTNGRKVVDRCGDLHWLTATGLVPMDPADAAIYHSLRGYDQRKLRGYCRINNKRRLDR